MMTNRYAHRSTLTAALVVLAALAATACTSVSLTETSPRMATIAGTASYRERIALPPNAVFEARLEEATGAGAPVVLGSTRTQAPKTPVVFSIAYDATRIQSGRRYLLRASISVDGRPFFAAETPFPPPGGAERVQILLVRTAAAPVPAPLALENTYWRLVALKGQAVQTTPGRTNEPHFVLRPDQKQVTGASGCNRMFGSYTLDGAKLTFGQLAGTMMACVEGMTLERTFLDTLMDVAAWRVTDQQLELLDERGQVLAQFEPRSGE